MFLEPNPTPYDLRWRMFGVPIRVHPFFWLVTVLMGANALQDGLEYLLIWVGCVFVSILVHELGHIWMGQSFGSYGHVVLYSFGGLAVGSNHLSQRWQRIAVCFAGPAAGFLLLGILFLLMWLRDSSLVPIFLNAAAHDLGLPPLMRLSEEARDSFHSLNPLMVDVIDQMIYINLLWGLVNLLPVWPLDGGQICRDACEGASRGRGLSVSLGISLAVAVLLAVFFLTRRQQFAAIMFGLLALYNFQLLQQARSQRRWLDDHWQRHDW